MSARQPELSEDMYRRIYRLIKRQVDPRIIANTLNIPLRTVESILARFEKTSASDFISDQDNSSKTADDHNSGFLDIYMYPKTRYAIMQIVGTLVNEFVAQFNDEIEKVYNTSVKALAIRMADITVIDTSACESLIKFKDKFHSYGKFFAILDPSPLIEAKFAEMKIDQIIPVFGTERAFEDAAFSRRTSSTIKR